MQQFRNASNLEAYLTGESLLGVSDKPKNSVIILMACQYLRYLQTQTEPTGSQLTTGMVKDLLKDSEHNPWTQTLLLYFHQLATF